MQPEVTEVKKNRRWLTVLVFGLLLIMSVGAVTVFFYFITQSTDDAVSVDTTKPVVAKNIPALTTTVVAGGLDHPWDVAFLPDQTLLMTERSGDISKIVDMQKTVMGHPEDVYVAGEGGMLGLAVDPEFSTNHFIYACFNSLRGDPDIRVARFKVDEKVASLSDRKDIVAGMPSAKSGRHSGCRIGFGADKNLWIGTGDAAMGANPQDLKSLGGKILRVNREGESVKGNLVGEVDPRVYSYGHRNIQGLAFYKSPENDSYGVSVEHGSYRDDEVNALSPGNFGWAPGLPYDESVEMTDSKKFPLAVKSIWSSGNPTIAPADADFLVGDKWGSWKGRLAMAVLKDKHLRLLEMKKDGTVGEQLKLFTKQFGRLRAVTTGPDGLLYITTDNGSNQDYVMRITPKL